MWPWQLATAHHGHTAVASSQLCNQGFVLGWKILPSCWAVAPQQPMSMLQQPSSLCKWYPAPLSSLKVCDPQDVQLSTRGNWLSLNIRLGKPSYCWVAPHLNYLLSNASSVMSETANGSLLKFHVSPLKCHRLERLSEDTDCWMWSCVMHYLLLSDKTLSLVK